MFVTCAPYRVRPTGRERLGTDSFILSVGCSLPGHLAPERTPVVEASGYVGIKDKFGFVSDGIEDGFDGVVAGAAWAKSVTVWLEACLPFRFEGHFS